MKLVNVLLATTLLAGASIAAEFKDYSALTKELRTAEKKAGNFATTAEVKAALKAKDWIVADARTIEEWNAAQIQGSQRIGRQAPEKALENFVVDLDGNFVKDKMILVCNSAARASIEAETYRKMGFTTVKIYDMYSWIDECNPVANAYSKKSDKAGTKNKFGMFYAEHCKK